VKAPARCGRGTYEGVCSSYLAGQKDGSVVHAFVKDTKSAFRLPDDPTVPIIMVGPGTGLAPFRGFLQERAALRAQGKAIGPSMLFFGCRHPEQDFIYAEELRAFADQGVTALAVGFSRVEGAQRAYVQDRIRSAADQVWQMIQAGATIYVCGDARRMAPDVRRAFAEIYRAKTNADEAAAERWLADLTAKNRYLVDVWAS
jgi:cytochrome P450/NADPH-cytochrome P450 reductase